MRTATIKLDEYGTRTITLFVPELSDIENLKVGDLAPSCFGGLARVTRIYALSRDIHGKRFVCYYTAMSERDTPENGCGCSASMKEGELVPTVAATHALKSADLDDAESYIIAGQPLPARLTLSREAKGAA